MRPKHCVSLAVPFFTLLSLHRHLKALALPCIVFRSWVKHINGVAYKAAAEEVEAAVSRSNDGIALCFDPRHALRVTSRGHRFEFLLCYACHQMAIYRDGKEIATLGIAGSSKPMNALLAAAKLPISKSYDEDAEVARAKQSEDDYRRWRQATPHSVRHIDVENLPGGGEDVIGVGEHVFARMASALAEDQPQVKNGCGYCWAGSAPAPDRGQVFRPTKKFRKNSCCSIPPKTSLAPWTPPN